MYLLTDAVMIPPKDNISSKQPRQERIVLPFLPTSGVQILKRQHRALVYHGKIRQVPRMLFCGTQDELQFLSKSDGRRSSEFGFQRTEQ